MATNAKSLLLDLLSLLGAGEMPVRVLTEVAELFGISDNSVRVTLARLVQRGLVTRSQRGSYRLSPDAEAVSTHVASWARLDRRMTTWRGDWIAVYTAALPAARGRSAARRKRALDFCGVRELERGLWIRPANLVGGVAELRATIYDLGLDRSALVAALGDLCSEDAERARSLWDVSSIRNRYRATTAALVASQRRLSRMSVGAAMAESFELGGAALRQMAYDPLLPHEILGGTERDQLVAEMHHYHRLGWKLWRPFVHGHGLVDFESPLRSRRLQGFDHLHRGWEAA